MPVDRREDATGLASGVGDEHLRLDGRSLPAPARTDASAAAAAASVPTAPVSAAALAAAVAAASDSANAAAAAATATPPQYVPQIQHRVIQSISTEKMCWILSILILKKNPTAINFRSIISSTSCQ